jgi:ElaB/YqjD/DUF883 family membrane-anchored ribosome-binding protein
MKKLTRYFSMGVLSAAMIFLVACNQQSKQQSEDKAKNEDLQELKAELKDVGREINQLAEKQGEDFTKSAEKVVNDVDQIISKFEDNLKENGEKIDYNTQQAITELKSSGQQLKIKLEKQKDKTQENWDELSKELKHDFKEFGKGVENFFSDNV